MKKAYKLVWSDGSEYHGSTSQVLSTRTRQHRTRMRRGAHANIYVQAKYGELGEPEVVDLGECKGELARITEATEALGTKCLNIIGSVSELNDIRYKKISLSLKNRAHGEAAKAKMSNTKKGMRRISNGVTRTWLMSTDEMPEGFSYGWN